MAVTAQRVFDISMSLIGQRADNGTIPTANVKRFTAKAPDFITLGQIDLAKAENIELETLEITALTQELEISDKTALSILPYYLSSSFLLLENPDLSNYFNQKYEELKRQIPLSEQSITDVYGITETTEGG